MNSINVVIAGKYQGEKIWSSKKRMFIGNIEINKETIDHFEVINENSTTTSFTNGKTKKSMIGAGAKGTVGAVIGTVIAPGIGTLIGAGAGVATSKGKTKSVTKEVTNKETTVAIYFTNGDESLVKMNGKVYEQFLIRAYSEPTPSLLNEQKDISIPATIAWLVFFYPVGLYRMWKNNQFSKTTRITITTVFVLATILYGKL